jgi:Toastrack DUF4097
MRLLAKHLSAKHLSIKLLALLSMHQMHTMSFKNITAYFSQHEEPPLKKDIAVISSVQIEIENTRGNINIKGWSQPVVSIEAIKRGTQEQLKTTNIRITASSRHITVTTTAEPDHAAEVTYNLMVPLKASVKVRLHKDGTIKIKKVEGIISAQSQHGDIHINGSVDSVIAKTTYGSLKIKVKDLPNTSSLFLETFKGNIELSIPPFVNATINARTSQGYVTSTIPLTTAQQTVILNKATWARFKKEVVGIFGNGGAPITAETTRGMIVIHGN